MQLRQEKGNGSVNQSVVITSTCVCVLCSCVRGWIGDAMAKGTEHAGRQIARCPFRRSVRLANNGQSFSDPLPAVSASGPAGWSESLVWVRLGYWRGRGGYWAGRHNQRERQCPAGQRDDPFRKLQPMRLDQGLPGRRDQVCEWLSCEPVRPAYWTWVPGCLAWLPGHAT